MPLLVSPKAISEVFSPFCIHLELENWSRRVCAKEWRWGAGREEWFMNDTLNFYTVSCIQAPAQFLIWSLKYLEDICLSFLL